MAKGESIEELLAPQLRVSRPVAACSRCRATKVRCDGRLPACTACERSDKADSCSGANDHFAKGKERSYVAALEVALEKLQKRVADTKAILTTDTSRRDTVAASYMLGPDHTLPSRRLPSGGRAHRREASDVDNLVGDFGFLSVNATSRDFHGFTSTMSFARLLLAASQTGDMGQRDTRSMPSRYMLTPTLQFYLHEIIVLLPFITETQVMTAISAVYGDYGRRPTPMHHWTYRMVLAIVSVYWSQDRGDANWHLAQQHVAAALCHAEDVLHPGSIAGVQAILLLVQYSMLDPELFSCWHLIGFASRVMVDLGLHNEPAAEVQMSKDDVEMRRRVFYCVYTLDRAIGMAFERAFSFTDDSVAVDPPVLPTSTELSGLVTETARQIFLRSLRPSIYLISIRQIQSIMYQETHSSCRSQWPSGMASSHMKSALKDIQAWESGIPDTMSKSAALLFRLESLYSQIFALAPSCRNPKITEVSRIVIFEYAIQYANKLYPLTRDNNWHVHFSVIDVHRTNFVARQFINILSTDLDELLSGAISRQPRTSRPEENGYGAESSSSPMLSMSRPTSGLENSTRAIRCIGHIAAILAYSANRFGECYGFPKILFEEESRELLQQLMTKQRELGTVQYITGGPPAPQQDVPPFDADRMQFARQPYGYPEGVPCRPGLEPKPDANGVFPIPNLEVEQFKAALVMPKSRPPLSGPGPQPRQLHYQQDLSLQPRSHELPPSYFFTLAPNGTSGVVSPYNFNVPQQNREGPFLDMPPSRGMVRREYQFGCTDGNGHGNGDENGNENDNGNGTENGNGNDNGNGQGHEDGRVHLGGAS
jgi:Fungal specific transcription factor domain/Fungal Zn(2)-Cys(6) binuclear cluster domain